MFFLLLFNLTVIFAPLAFAQTWTECNPLNKTCPNNPALGTSHNFIFNSSSTVTESFNYTAGYLKYGTGNAEFTISERGDSPTIQSKFYIMFGSVSVVMKAAPGRGVISSIVLESEDLDEIDWEFLGGNGTHVESNYFGKGNISSFDRAIYHPVSFDPRDNFHNYSIHWTADQLEWWIDSELVRTLPYAAANNGQNYPQTPMSIRIGIWAGGDKRNSPGTIDWAGGVVDYAKCPYTMEVKSTQITDFGSGKEYQWTDRTGSWESIKSIPGNSTALKAILKAEEPPPPSLLEQFLALPSATKLPIYCTAGGFAALLSCVLIFVCHRSRRQGRQERQVYEARLEKEREETYKYQMELQKQGRAGWGNELCREKSEDTSSDSGKPEAPKVDLNRPTATFTGADSTT